MAIIFLDANDTDGDGLGDDQFESETIPRIGEEVKLYDDDHLISQGVVVKVEYRYWKDGTEIVYVILRLVGALKEPS